MAAPFLLQGQPARAQVAAPPFAGHFYPKGKAPSQLTLDALSRAREFLPFADTTDFVEQSRGLIAQMTELQIQADAGHAAWDLQRFIPSTSTRNSTAFIRRCTASTD